jgi:hypothetical protein
MLVLVIFVLLVSVKYNCGLMLPSSGACCRAGLSKMPVETAVSANKPNTVTPTAGTGGNSVIEKFLMMYTCKLCSGRNAQMVRL